MIEGRAIVLDELCARVLEMKRAEDITKNRRVKLELEIAALVGQKLEGTDKEATDTYKITVTSKLTRTLDYDAYLALEESLPVSCVDLKPTLNLKNYRHIEAVAPEVAAQFITVKPAKPSVSVEVA